MVKVLNEQRFLGRVFDKHTKMWVFSDKSGISLPNNIKIEIEQAATAYFPNGLNVLSLLFSYKDRNTCFSANPLTTEGSV